MKPYLWVDQSSSVIDTTPRRDSNRHDRILVSSPRDGAVPNRLANMLHHPRVHPSRNDPGPSAVRGLDQPVPEDLLEARVQAEVLGSSGNGNKKVWLFHTPLMKHHVFEVRDVSVVLQPHKLNEAQYRCD